MTGMVGNKWSFDDFSPMDVIPTFVCLTTYDGGPDDFMLTPLDELVEQVAAGMLRVQVGKVFKLDDIGEAHRCMEDLIWPAQMFQSMTLPPLSDWAGRGGRLAA